ncbi:MAG: tRNA-dihydrouridine synthase family protein [Lachnospiraceae bacterium]|nr:tRNA-dihydrouridine synthase family protein [Lachnospiraceae bacterium]
MIYFAPLEDVSGYMFRNLFNSMFTGVDRFYAPFISAMEPGRRHKRREIEDVSPDNNTGVELIPQILTNDPGDFLNTAELLMEKGYREINLNLGCPSKDVVSRGKGSGFLSFPDRLDRFFDEVFSGLKERGREDTGISVKTRIGRRDNGNVHELIRIFNRYPLTEVTVHPRLGKDFYRGEPDMESFDAFYEGLKMPVVYNGDIKSPENIRDKFEKYSGLKAVMIGRGFIRNPALAREYKGGEALNKAELRLFLEKLYGIYTENLNAEKYAIDKMKELWGWIKDNPYFADEQRKIRTVHKSRNAVEYESAVRQVFTGSGS